MTEAEWFAEPDFTRHLRFVEDRLSPRKLRLLAAAFCRAVWHLHSHWDIRVAVEKAEQSADGTMGQFEIPVEDYGRRCREVAVRSHEVWAQWAGVDPAEELKWWLLHDMAWAAALAASTPLSVEAVGHRVISAAVQAQTRQSGVLQSQSDAEHDRLMVVQNRLLRTLVWDVAGNPFRPVAFEPGWRTGTVVAIARGMYEGNDFSGLPILADALMDAGCDDEDVLAHCRGPGGHVRGCWVVDGVLGKS